MNRLFPALAVVVLTCALAPTSARADSSEWQRAVEGLQYLESDYPAAVQSGSPTELEEQKGFAHESLRILESLGPSGAPFLEQMRSISDRIDRGQDPAGVARDCAALVEGLVQAGGLTRSPRTPPDLAKGKALFAQDCAICHGASGHADTPTAKQLDPPPASFHDPEVMASMTPYKAFNVMTFGVSGTPMPAYVTLTEDERWALAFYVFTLRQPPCDQNPPRVSLEALATSTDAALAQQHGEKAVACLRQHFPQPDEEKSLLLAREGVEKALALAAQGHAREATSTLLSAYLNGVEPVEGLLGARDPKIVQQIEQGFIQTRVDVERQDPKAQESGKALLSLIDRARRATSATSTFLSVFWLAALVVVREGFEATVVIAALLAVLKKMDAKDSVRTVHVAWISALGVGGIFFAVAHQLLSGANRELLEGVTALAAVAMLLYAALWLNAKANIRKFMGELREKMQSALGSGSRLGLFTIAFTAVFRESFECVLFLQGLSVDSPSGAAWGALLGAVAMVGLVLFVKTVGFRLPMKALFTTSTVLLFLTAVVLLGQGVHSLQEVGALPLAQLPGPQVEALGLFPDLYSLVPQLLLLLSPLPYWWWKRRGAAGAGPSSLSQASR